MIKMTLSFYVQTINDGSLETGISLSVADAETLLRWIGFGFRGRSIWDVPAVPVRDFIPLCKSKLDVPVFQKPSARRVFMRDRLSELLSVCKTALDLDQSAAIYWR